MKATELRIRNYVSISIERFGDYRKGDTYQIGYEDFVNEDSFNPILLTEEWLLKFGFEFHSYDVEGDTMLRKDNVYATKCTRCIREIHIEVGLNDLFGVKCEFVHKLQNLYHCLSGTELTIKE